MRPAVFFDLDGTLTDPETGITRCIRYAFDRLGLDCPDNDLRWCIGPPLLESFETLVGPALAPRALALYRERFNDVGWRENAAYPGIAELLADLSRADRVLFVATSKPLVYAERIVQHFGFGDYFERVFGADLDGTRTRKEDLLQYALAETGVSGDSLMVGDRQHDIAGARANGLGSVGVTWGFGSRQELEDANADTIADSPVELARLLV